jgi:hypothetical protein
MSHIGGQHPLEMATVPDQDPVQALGPNAAHPTVRQVTVGRDMIEFWFRTWPVSTGTVLRPMYERSLAA